MSRDYLIMVGGWTRSLFKILLESHFVLIEANGQKNCWLDLEIQ